MLELPRQGIRSYLYQRTPTHRHQGIDLGAAEGTPVYAVGPGRVTHASAELEQGFSGYGGHVAIDGGPVHFLYAHLQSVNVRPGELVSRGQQIGTVGRTCFSREDPHHLCSGPHLHFEVSPGAYPQASEAPRIDPVAALEALEAHPFAPSSSSSPGPSPVAPAPMPAPMPAPLQLARARGPDLGFLPWLFVFGLVSVTAVAVVQKQPRR